MFTGIIQGQGTLHEKRPLGKGLLFGLVADFDLTDPAEGESIAVNGVCLTAHGIKGNRFGADVSPESLSRTALGSLSVGDRVNLERALRLSDRLGGHLVSGHVDAQGEVKQREKAGSFTLFTFSIPIALSKYVVQKGSITINGVSLTVNACGRDWFMVSIIPHTLAITTLGQLKAGDRVNLEVDLIGKYVEKLLAEQSPGGMEAQRINPAFLAKHGFL